MSTIDEQIQAVEEEIRKTPYDKSTQRHHGMLRAKLARLKDKQTIDSSRKSGGGGGYAVKKQGDATIVLVGPPSAGKSTLINALTNAESKVAPYAFTTLSVIPGMMHYKSADIQILDVPGLIEGAQKGKGRGKEVLSVIRGSDLLVIMSDPVRINMIDTMVQELEEAGIRINKRPPQVSIQKKLNGGIAIHSNIKQELDMETIKDVANEFGYKNAEISLKEKVTMETLIDAFATNRVYIPAVFVINKSDTPEFAKVKEKTEKLIVLPISADKNIGLDILKEKIWEHLEFVTIYLVEALEQPNFDHPMIVTTGTTLGEVALTIGTEFAETKTKAKIWGSGAKFAGQEVSLKAFVVDGMQIKFT